MVATAETAEDHDFAARDAGESAFHVIDVVARDGRFVGALRECGFECQQGGVEISDERVLSATAETFGQGRLAPARSRVLQLVENLVEGAVHEVHERVGVGEGRVDGGGAQTRRPL